MIDPILCQLCGNPDKRDLHKALVHWIEAPMGMAYSHVDVCRDREACKRRVAIQGDIWPLVEQPGDHRRAS